MRWHAACAQAKEYIPDLYTGAVKHATERNVAVRYENADTILTETVKKSLENYKTVSLYRLSEPATVEWTFYRTEMCETALKRCGEDVERVDARTLRRSGVRLGNYASLKF